MKLHMTEAEREFRELYGKMQKEYGMWMHLHASVFKWEDDIIEIWRMADGRNKETVCRIKEKDIEDCYKKAIIDLKHYDMRKRMVKAEG